MGSSNSSSPKTLPGGRHRFSVFDQDFHMIRKELLGQKPTITIKRE